MVYLPQALQIPEAGTVAAGTRVGLFDQFIPTIVSTNIDSPITHFVLAGLSATQLIFMAARLEYVAKKVGYPIVCTSDVKEKLNKNSTDLASKTIKGS